MERCMTSRWTVGLLALVVSAGLSAQWMAQAAEKPKHSIKQTMKDLHKGDDALCKKVARGEGTAEEHARLVEYYTDLPGQKPPKGDQAEWDRRANDLLSAAKALHKKEAGAVEAYKKAVNCKACHNPHKAD
jgi:hypothetical protein